MSNEKIIGMQLIDGIIFNVVVGHGCDGCVFQTDENDCIAGEAPNCSSTQHPTGKSVQFRNVENPRDCRDCNSNCNKVCAFSQGFKDRISVMPDKFLPNVNIGETICKEQNIKPQFHILCEIGDLLGIEAYTQDDGKILSEPIVEKLPELVAKLVYTNTKLKSELNALKTK